MFLEGYRVGGFGFGVYGFRALRVGAFTTLSLESLKPNRYPKPMHAYPIPSSTMTPPQTPGGVRAYKGFVEELESWNIIILMPLR